MADKESGKKKKEEEKQEPAVWKPINLEKFNKSTGEVSAIFRADPDRVSERQDDNPKKED